MTPLGDWNRWDLESDPRAMNGIPVTQTYSLLYRRPPVCFSKLLRLVGKVSRQLIAAPFFASTFLLLTALRIHAATSEIKLRWTPDLQNTNRVNVEVAGVSSSSLQAIQRAKWTNDQWRSLLSVYVEAENKNASANLPPILGTYRIAGNVIRFEPQFPVEPGLRYRADFRTIQLPSNAHSKNTLVLSASYQAPARASATATFVDAVYPSADVLPENLLKFYIHFSASMSRGNIYSHIHLKNSAGKDIELPFLELDEELWDREMMRLTLFIDPGRIKRGLRPLEEVGPSLETGKEYALVIDSDWKDGNGFPLRNTFRKNFRVSQPDRNPIDHTLWKVETPRAGTKNPLAINFTKSLDHALALRMIRVASVSRNSTVEGTPTLADHESRWLFQPATAWSAGAYELRVQSVIEDLAGNNLGKAFDVDVFEGVQKKISNSVETIRFEIR